MANWILSYALVMLASLAPGEAKFKTEEVNIHVNIHSSIYTYTVTNISSSDIVGFELDQHSCYNFTTPDGWDFELISGVFQARAGDTQAVIGPEQSGQFSMRVSSSGAVLGQKPIKLKLQSGETIIVDKVWAPVREPRCYAVLVAGMILLVLLGHTLILIHRDHQKKKASIN